METGEAPRHNIIRLRLTFFCIQEKNSELLFFYKADFNIAISWNAFYKHSTPTKERKNWRRTFSVWQNDNQNKQLKRKCFYLLRVNNCPKYEVYLHIFDIRRRNYKSIKFCGRSRLDGVCQVPHKYYTDKILWSENRTNKHTEQEEKKTQKAIALKTKRVCRTKHDGEGVSFDAIEWMDRKRKTQSDDGNISNDRYRIHKQMDLN